MVLESSPVLQYNNTNTMIYTLYISNEVFMKDAYCMQNLCQPTTVQSLHINKEVHHFSEGGGKEKSDTIQTKLQPIKLYPLSCQFQHHQSKHWLSVADTIFKQCTEFIREWLVTSTEEQKTLQGAFPSWSGEWGVVL